MEVLVNTVNCVGIMGKGIAKEFKEKYPDMFHDYRERCASKLVRLGEPYLYESNDIFGSYQVLNFPTKNHWRSSSKVSDIVAGLDYFIENYKKWGIKSIAFPPLGCGNGGLKWDKMGRIIYQKLKSLEIDIELYAPHSTSHSEITDEYLDTNIDYSDEYIVRKSQETIKSEWNIPLECLYRLQDNKYNPPVGRVKFQKMVYLLTELGIETDVKFVQGKYGPFSSDVKVMIHYFSNANLVIEENYGAMTKLIVTKEYENYRKKYLSLFSEYEKKITKTKVLFEKIRTTEKAEEVTSIIYKIIELKKNLDKVSDNDILHALLKWKKHWDNDVKRESLISSIKNLAILRWIDIEFSDELLKYDIL